MNELIKIHSDNKVSGRELYEFLVVETKYNDWLPRMCEYGFVEGEDFNLLKNEKVQIEGNRKVKRMVDDAAMTIDMAKEICMLQRTDRGKQARQYFIECEKRLNGQRPLSQLEILQGSVERLVQHEHDIEVLQQAQEETNKRIDGMKDVISLTAASWRKDTTVLINKMAIRAGDIAKVREFRRESYQLLDERMGVSVETRLVNLKRRMYEAGYSKTKIDNVNALDVIGQDKKLVEGYVAVIKDMAIKYGVAA